MELNIVNGIPQLTQQLDHIKTSIDATKQQMEDFHKKSYEIFNEFIWNQ